jgi:hypothetical protein
VGATQVEVSGRDGGAREGLRLRFGGEERKRKCSTSQIKCQRVCGPTSAAPLFSEDDETTHAGFNLLVLVNLVGLSC